MPKGNRFVWHVSKALGYSTHCQEITQSYLHTLRFIRKLYLPVLSAGTQLPTPEGWKAE